MILAATGHRPDKLDGYNPAAEFKLTTLAELMLTCLRPAGTISGMALGWDQAVAVASIRLGIPFVAAIPFVGQESLWPLRAQQQYIMLIGAASQLHVVSKLSQVEEAGIPWAMQKRNEWMVDNSTALLALWNGDRTGGTFNCVQYAREGGREIINVWDLWSLL